MSEEASAKVDFRGLVAGIATSAVAVLSQVEILLQPQGAADTESDDEDSSLSHEELQKRIGDGLAGARQLIDTLALLEEKTKGNLTKEETELLQTSLSELRIHYVSLANRPVPEVQQGADGGQ